MTTPDQKTINLIASILGLPVDDQQPINPAEECNAEECIRTSLTIDEMEEKISDYMATAAARVAKWGEKGVDI